MSHGNTCDPGCGCRRTPIPPTHTLMQRLEVIPLTMAILPTLDDSWWCGDHVDYHETNDEGEPLPCCVEARADQARSQANAIRAYVLGDAASVHVTAEESSLADVVSDMQMQRHLDNEPCTTCGGDRLRPDFVTAGRCHVPTEATR